MTDRGQHRDGQRSHVVSGQRWNALKREYLYRTGRREGVGAPALDIDDAPESAPGDESSS